LKNNTSEAEVFLPLFQFGFGDIKEITLPETKGVRTLKIGRNPNRKPAKPSSKHPFSGVLAASFA